ncbi:TPA: PTS sugar transporter subunit IIA [Enterococcus faecium]|uniref:PTS sugar transporter subunit IIA n=1 Tax=Enterococcus faecium TaxID=1352 RepID=UPI0010E9A808|nr:PTS sugar transporter subunit IIA [Enterococcus faecium]MDQ8223720.1 PTS sugar transporter subunit IIA [Enterococcus faecium]VTQ50212.1 PTS system transporter subunit IIA [Enterococcus faecium]HAR1380487.1 PTS sugar transporter subunit IIA [Enterococcus faecium]HAR1394452.1 PTS sugar transporter subunit IIA [Enterococcus faecium]
MNKVILVAHGKLAHEMKNSAEMIFGSLPNFETIEFLKEEGLDTIQRKIMAAMHDGEASYLVLTDLFCGTPYNASCAVAMKNPDREIEVVSGMSFPIVLEIASMIENSLQDIVNCVTNISCETVKSFKHQLIEEEEDF